MNINHLGEFGLIKRFAPHFLNKLPEGVEGIGDDCAIIPYSEDQSWLVTTDLLLENIHFLKHKIQPNNLGYKSLAVNLSDIAAMGGKPLYAFLSLGLPADCPVQWVDEFFEGFGALAQENEVLLLGGDTTRSSQDSVINVLILGQMPTQCIKRRSAAQLGDIICCTGFLGDSGGGLKVLLEDLPIDTLTSALVNIHYRPRPHLAEGQWLAQQKEVHAMMDISDGIDSDIHRIMEQSHCGALIELDKLPVSPALKEASVKFDWNPLEMAATSGEDYCLLTTVDPMHYASLNLAFQKEFNRSLYKIGEITSSSQLLYQDKGIPVQLTSKGFDHFQ